MLRALCNRFPIQSADKLQINASVETEKNDEGKKQQENHELPKLYLCSCKISKS